MDRTPEDDIAEALGRPIPAGELGSVHHLNEFPPALLADARRLTPLLRRAYLRVLVDAPSRGYVARFDDAVFERGKDAAAWERGGALLPWLTREELVARSVAEILAPLGRPGEMPRARMPMNAERWQRFDAFVGAPAVSRDDLDYRSTVPARTMRVLPPLPSLEAVADVALATRRWVAARIAQEARRAAVSLDVSEPADLLRNLGVAAPASADALVALGGLLAERKDSSLPPGVPGFVGPDDWYRGRP